VHIILPFLLVLIPCFVSAQNNRAEQQAKYTLTMARTNTPIVVDGDVSEPVWQSASEAGNFWMKWPRDGGPAPQQTSVRCLYDDRFLYVSAVCYDNTPKNVIQSLKRDNGYWDSDGFAMVLDPTNTANNGYFFAVNAAGVQTEGLLSTAKDDADLNWDNTWQAAVKTYADKWTVEYAIPLRILRFKEGQAQWGVNFIRNDLGNGMYSIWASVPFQFDGLNLGWTGALRWETAPKRTKGSYNIIPYGSTALSKDYEPEKNWQVKPNGGLDAKIGIGSGMNLDVTVNPDFSQVEIDQQVVNLTRFDVQLPEKRTFFLENADIFSNFGTPLVRPFFSRRIGLDNDGNPLPILGGLRLSGNLNSDTRLGIMTIQTGKKNGIPSRNNTAIAFNRRVFGRSTVSGFFLDREDFTAGKIVKNSFSRNAGMEFSFISNNGKWNAWATHHRSIKPNISSKNWGGNTGFAYNSRQLSTVTDIGYIGEHYYADLGYEQRIENVDVLLDSVLRIPYGNVFNDIRIKIFPKNQDSKFNFSEFGNVCFLVFNEDGTINELSSETKFSSFFKSTSEISVGIVANYNNIPVSFSIGDGSNLVECPPILAGKYRYKQMNWSYSGDYRKPFTWKLGGVAGEYFNGHQYSFLASVGYRFQPFVNLRLEAEINKLNFPHPICDAQYVNITPRVEVFFAKNIWWTTFIQYNTQSDNFNLNSRLQWRYRPMSDVFLVYTDNYAVKFWGPKNKALVLKVNYWL
jgi:hypothetical protein